MSRRPQHYIAPTSSPSYISRVRAIALPCPPFLHLTPRSAAIFSSGLGAIIYFLWAIAMWRSHTALSRRLHLTAEGSIGEIELGGLTSYTNWSFYFAGTACVGWFGTFVACAMPQVDFLRHLSRLNWITWIATWMTGILGLVAYLASDAWLKETCGTTDECWYFWKSIQFATITSLFATLTLIFWFSVSVSAYTHTLHPHLFYDDSDEEDERWIRHGEELRAAIEFPETDSEEEEERMISRRHANRRANSAKKRSLSRGGMVTTRSAVEPYRQDYPEAQQPARRPAYTEEMDDDEEWTRPSSRPSSRPASRAPSADEYSSAGEGDSESDDREEGVRLMGMQGRGRRLSTGSRG